MCYKLSRSSLSAEATLRTVGHHDEKHVHLFDSMSKCSGGEIGTISLSVYRNNNFKHSLNSARIWWHIYVKGALKELGGR